MIVLGINNKRKFAYLPLVCVPLHHACDAPAKIMFK